MTDLFSVLPNRIYCCSAGDNLPVMVWAWVGWHFIWSARNRSWIL